MSVFEIIMLICFGASWPASVIKSYRSRSTGGKSLLFLILIGTGYLVGLVGKILYNPGIIILVYCCNTLLVLTDMMLYFRNRRIEKQEAAKKAAA